MPEYQIPTVKIETPDNVVYDKFSSGKFVTSPVGFLRLMVIVLLLISAILFLSTDICSDTPVWFDWLFPVIATVTAVFITIDYAAFACGIGKNNPYKWAKIILCSFGLCILIIFFGYFCVCIWTIFTDPRSPLTMSQDIIVSLIESLIIVIVSGWTISACPRPSSVQKFPGPLGISAAVLLAVSTAALYILWKQQDEDLTKIPSKQATPQMGRISVLV